jgi:hypothetical protein
LELVPGGERFGCRVRCIAGANCNIENCSDNVDERPDNVLVCNGGC